MIPIVIEFSFHSPSFKFSNTALRINELCWLLLIFHLAVCVKHECGAENISISTVCQAQLKIHLTSHMTEYLCVKLQTRFHDWKSKGAGEG